MREVPYEVWSCCCLGCRCVGSALSLLDARQFPQTVAHSVMSLLYSSPLGLLPSLSSSSLLLVNLQERQPLPL